MELDLSGKIYMSLYHLLPKNTVATDYGVHPKGPSDHQKGVTSQIHPTANKFIMVIISNPKLLSYLQQAINSSLRKLKR